MLLVRAFEEGDPDGRLLSAGERARATEAARTLHPDDEEALLLSRAESLLSTLEQRVPRVRDLLAVDHLAPIGRRVLLVLALVLGLSTQALGPLQHVHVLSAPLLGLFAWNLVVYLLVLWWMIRRPRETQSSDTNGALSGASTLAARGGGWLARFSQGLVRRAFGRVAARRAEEQRVVAAGVALWASSWGRSSARLLGAHLRHLFHLGAAVVMTGAVAGMYLRGLLTEYKATWQSTFLDAERVQTLLDTLLGPAARLLGETVPAVAPLRAPSDGEAAIWIHLYALTALLGVVLPRLLLTLVEVWKLRRLRAAHPLDLEDPAFRRLLVRGRARAQRVDVQPYSVQLDVRRREALQALLHDLFGSRADVRVNEASEYGDAWEPLGDDAHDWCSVIVFALGQSPEVEVHGELLSEARASLSADQQVLVVIDASRFRERVGEIDERMQERRRAWDRVVREAELQAVHVDLLRPPRADVVLELEAALWPPRRAASAS
ncbi:MAG: hypothetical protein DHS20C15_33690 [Planctomycetota bacterium]|nr:MAG: hypothetical protein DHS20C15_33690 [Planctomycetota bacterium]